MSKTEKSKRKLNIDTLVDQAREGVRTLENLVGIPPHEERKRRANDKIKEGIRSIGLATREELAALEARVNELESQLEALRSKTSTASDASPEAH